MAKALFNRTNQGDAANIFVRNLLCDLSESINPKGLTKSDWKKTILFFDHRCPYTGKKLPKSKIVFDHIIPLNKTSRGLHLFGNLIPTSSHINAKKADKDFEIFIRSLDDSIIDVSTNKTELIERIKEFQEISGYNSINFTVNEHFKQFIDDQYAMFKSNCENNKSFFLNHNVIIQLQEDLNTFSAKDILPKIRIWACKPNLNVHKIIAIVAEKKQLYKIELLNLIEKSGMSKNPNGTLLSLMSNKGNSYGKVLFEENELISFVPEITERINMYNWKK